MRTNSGRRHCVVVGGGVTGCATAYFLSSAGLHVTLIERDAVAAHASGKNAGNLNPVYQTAHQLVPMALEAFALHGMVRTELGRLGCAHYELRPAARIHLGCTERELSELRDCVEETAQTDCFSTRSLSSQQLRELEPGLAERFTGGLMLLGHLTVEGAAFARSLVEGALRHGTRVLHETVTGVLSNAKRIEALRTSSSVVPCDDVVFATGPWVDPLKEWLGTPVAIEPLKGELLLMRLPEGAPRHDLHWRSTAIYVRGRDSVLVGGTLQRSGLDSSPTAEAKSRLLHDAAQVLPTIRRAILLDHLAALRPMSATELPLAERAPGWENAYLANGGGSKGVLLSLAIARGIRDLLLPTDPFAWKAKPEVSCAASLH
jgi:glycine oxidase